MKVSFAQKISLHMVLLILVTGISVTAVTTIQFRHKLYEQEFSRAYTTYMATVNYLTGHYRSHRDNFNRRILRFVLDEKFMQLPGDAEGLEQRLTRLVLYDANAQLHFEYDRMNVSLAPQQLPKDRIPTEYKHWYDRDAQRLHVAGPIDQEGAVPGYVEIEIPTTIDAEILRLYKNSLAIIAVMLLLTIVVSIFFARRSLAPVEELTHTARKVHDGDLTQRVAVHGSDEISMLSMTFNEMLDSLLRRIAMMRHLQDWTMRIGGQFELDRLYGTLADMFRSLAGSASCTLFLRGGKTDQVLAYEPQGEPSTVAGSLDDACQNALDNGVASIPSNPEQSLALPLVTGERKIGVVRLGPRTNGQPYDDEIMAPLMTMAQHAAVAVENGRMYRELADRERFEQEMKWAREIQRSMLPRITPVLEGFEVFGTSQPAFEVGGDYFDYVQVGSRWHFIVGDVSGKGVPAALIMSILRSLIHTYVEMSSSPKEILRRVNRNLSPDLEPGMFVTVASVTLELKTGDVELVRAGHEPVMIIRADGSVERFEPGGTALGLVEVARFDEALEEMRVHLSPGDTVLLYTDGITEARDSNGDELGYQGVEAMACRHRTRPAKEMIKAMIEDLKAFSGNGDQLDDITLVALRRSAS